MRIKKTSQYIEGGLSISDIYPVGSIYMSVNSTSPATLFGFGTWEQLKDRFLLGAGSTYTAGNTGGEASHKLTVNEIPSHGHEGRVYYTGDGNWATRITTYPKAIFGSNGALTGGSGIVPAGENRYIWNVTSSNPYTHAFEMPTANTSNSGGSQNHNNMPPYIVVYMWRRTA